MVRKLGALTWEDFSNPRAEAFGQPRHIRRYYVSGKDVTPTVMGMIEKRLIVEPGLQELLDAWND